MNTLRRDRLRLLLAVASIAVVWTSVLPWIGNRPLMRRMIERNEARGIDPSAMFYTELDHMRFRDGMMRPIVPPESGREESALIPGSVTWPDEAPLTRTPTS